MVALYTERAPRRQQFRLRVTSHVATVTTSVYIQKQQETQGVNRQSYHSFWVAYTTRAQWVCSEAKNSAIAAIMKSVTAHLQIKVSSTIPFNLLEPD